MRWISLAALAVVFVACSDETSVAPDGAAKDASADVKHAANDMVAADVAVADVAVADVAPADVAVADVAVADVAVADVAVPDLGSDAKTDLAPDQSTASWDLVAVSGGKLVTVNKSSGAITAIGTTESKIT